MADDGHDDRLNDRPPDGQASVPPAPLIQTTSLRVLLVVPVILAVATAAVLFTRADVNVALLYSQCDARARLPGLTRHVPRVVGTPSCFVVSFMEEALGGTGGGGGGGSRGGRAVAVMASVLAFVGGLLTVSTVEAARVCNGPSVLIAYPTGAWLAFTLVGGAVVWELVILPAFFRRSKQLLEGDSRDLGASIGSLPPLPPLADGGGGGGNVAPRYSRRRRHLAVVAEVAAIPTAVALGFVVPSIVMLVTDAPAAVAVWLFFPVYVTAVRQGLRWAIVRCLGVRDDNPVLARLQRLERLRPYIRRSMHLESHRPSLVAVYALPVLCSAVAHLFLLWHWTARSDDRREMTRSTLRFVEIDFVFIGLTVLYWVLVEAGWQVVLLAAAWSLLLGPGAGVCLGWIHREQQLGLVADDDDYDDDGDDGEVAGEGVPHDGRQAGDADNERGIEAGPLSPDEHDRPPLSETTPLLR